MYKPDLDDTLDGGGVGEVVDEATSEARGGFLDEEVLEEDVLRSLQLEWSGCRSEASVS